MKYCMLILVVVGVCMLPYTAFAGCQMITITENGQMKMCTVCYLPGGNTTITCM